MVDEKAEKSNGENKEGLVDIEMDNEDQAGLEDEQEFVTLELEEDSESSDAFSDDESSDDLSEADQTIAALEKERDNLKDSLLRKVAEFENLKRRTAREKDEAVRYGTGAILSSMLEVIDNFDRAVENEPTEEDFHSFFMGVKLISRNLKEVFKSHGLEELNPQGEQFDPFYHEAMMREETAEHEDNEVLEVFQKGYKLKDRLLRPARVKVAVKITEPVENQENSSDQEGSE